MKMKRTGCGFWRDESGTSLTEFVIVLPVFLLVFSGVLNLYKVQMGATTVKMKAYAQAIENTQQISDSFMGLNGDNIGDLLGMLDSAAKMQPASGAVAAANYHRKMSSGGRRVTNIALDGFVAAGHMGESWSRVVLPSLLEKNLTPYFDVNSVPRMDGQLFASSMFDDSLYGWSAVAAGIRYGIGHSDPNLVETVVAGKQSFEFRQGYHLAAPPEPTSRLLTYGVIRKVMSSSKAWDQHILAFEMEPYSGSGEVSPEIKKCMEDAEALSKRSFSASDVVPGAKKPTDGMCDGVMSTAGFDFFDGLAKDGDVGGVNPFEDGIQLKDDPFRKP